MNRFPPFLHFNSSFSIQHSSFPLFPPPGYPTRMSVRPAVTAFIAFGANLGDRHQNIRAALAKLARTDGVELTRVSSFLENPAIGGPPDSPAFINAVAEIHTTLGSHALLHSLLQIESDLGRTRPGFTDSACPRQGG